MTETVLKAEAIDVLIKTFGVLDTERFITSIKSDNFDYTEWHKNLWKDKTIEEIHMLATEAEAFKNMKKKNG
jgi:hypothetical protein